MYAWLDSTPVLALSRLLAAALPREAAQPLATAAGRAAHALLERPRRALERRGVPSLRALVNYARTRADLFYLERLVERVEGPPDPPREAVYVSGHVGNWELGGAWLARRFGLTVLALRPRTAFARFVDARRAAWGVETAHTDVAGLRRFLRAAPPVAAMIDRRGGRIAAAHAWRHERPLVPLWTTLEPSGRYRLRLEEPIPARRRPGETAAEGTARLARELERVVEAMRRRHRDQWFPFTDGP
jgi:lauroyl/myristoyl acyltransferase